MRNLFRYLVKNYGFFLFLFLEIISFILIVNNNPYQQVKFLNSSDRLVASTYNGWSSVLQYFRLNAINRELSDENARLKGMLSKIQEFRNDTTLVFVDPLDSFSVYRYIPARVINNSTNKSHNYITLNRGHKHGVKPDQGIITASGVVGVVTDVSESFAVGLSLLNQRWSISARLKSSGFYGSLSWDGNDYRFAMLSEIPFHVQLAPGDTVVTSGFSRIFPEGIMIGTIQSFEQPPGGNYYTIKVKLSTNFKTLSFVEVIVNNSNEEISTLENQVRDNAVID